MDIIIFKLIEKEIFPEYFMKHIINGVFIKKLVSSSYYLEATLFDYTFIFICPESNYRLSRSPGKSSSGQYGRLVYPIREYNYFERHCRK